MGGTWLIYDGACPFCSSYVRLARLREAVGKVDLINARDGGAEVEEAKRAGLRLDDGMVLKFEGKLYHGDEALHRIALLASPSTAFNRFNSRVFRSRTASRSLYPLMRWGRVLALCILRRGKIGA